MGLSLRLLNIFGFQIIKIFGAWVRTLARAFPTARPVPPPSFACGQIREEASIAEREKGDD
jgi:hypothetical protein